MEFKKYLEIEKYENGYRVIMTEDDKVTAKVYEGDRDALAKALLESSEFLEPEGLNITIRG